MTEPLTLAGYVKAPQDDAWAASCEAEATAIVHRRILGAMRAVTLTGAELEAALVASNVPAEVRSRAILESGAELFYRRDALAGNAQMDDGVTQPRRLRDPHRIAAEIVDPFLGPGIA